MVTADKNNNPVAQVWVCISRVSFSILSQATYAIAWANHPRPLAAPEGAQTVAFEITETDL